MDQQQREELLSLFSEMEAKAANDEKRAAGGKLANLGNTQIGGHTIVLCGKKTIRKILTAALRTNHKGL